MDPRAFTAMAARPSVPPILTPASWDSSGGDQVPYLLCVSITDHVHRVRLVPLHNAAVLDDLQQGLLGSMRPGFSGAGHVGGRAGHPLVQVQPVHACNVGRHAGTIDVLARAHEHSDLVSLCSQQQRRRQQRDH